MKAVPFLLLGALLFGSVRCGEPVALQEVLPNRSPVPEVRPGLTVVLTGSTKLKVEGYTRNIDTDVDDSCLAQNVNWIMDLQPEDEVKILVVRNCEEYLCLVKTGEAKDYIGTIKQENFR